MILLEDKGRDYRRYRPSADEKIQLAEKDLQWVLSSNVSAVGTAGDALIIRFHNGSVYAYPNQAKLYRPMLQSNSKGRFVWDRLRRRNVPYQKIDSMPLKSDVPISDEDLFEKLSTEEIRVESPQVIDSRDVVFKPNIFKVAASILILDNIMGIEILPINILNQTNTSL